MPRLADVLGDQVTPVLQPVSSVEGRTTLADVLGQAQPKSEQQVDVQKIWDEDPDILGWRTDLMYNYGIDPKLSENEGEYNLVKAIQLGARPQKVEGDAIAHWPDQAANGEFLKTPNHPTYWMGVFTRQHGVTPEQLGIKSKEEAEALFGPLSVEAPAAQPLSGVGQTLMQGQTALKRMRQRDIEFMRKDFTGRAIPELMAGMLSWLPSKVAGTIATGVVDEKVGVEVEQKWNQFLSNLLLLDPNGERFSKMGAGDFESLERIGNTVQAVVDPVKKGAEILVQAVDPLHQPLEGKRKAIIDNLAEIALFTVAPFALKRGIRGLQSSPLWRRMTIKEKGVALQDFQTWANSQRGLPPEQVIKNAADYWGENSIQHQMAKAASEQFATRYGSPDGPTPNPADAAGMPIRADFGPVRAQYEPSAVVYPRYYGMRPPTAMLKPEQDFELGAGPYNPAGERVGEPYGGAVALRGETRPAELTKEGRLVGEGLAIPQINRAIPVGDPYGSDFELVFGAGALARRGQTLPAQQGNKAVIPWRIALGPSAIARTPEGRPVKAPTLTPQEIQLGVESITGSPELAAKITKEETGTQSLAQKIWTDDRLEREIRSTATRFNNTSKTVIAWVNPKDFVLATTPIGEEMRIAKEAGPLDLPRMQQDYQTPFLYVDRDTGQIDGHEGRHRMQALANEGVQSFPIVINYRERAEYERQDKTVLLPEKFDGGRQGQSNLVASNLISLIDANKEVIRHTIDKTGTSPQPQPTPPSPNATLPERPATPVEGGEVPTQQPIDNSIVESSNDALRSDVEQMASQAIAEADRAELMREIVARKRLAQSAKAELSLIEQQREFQNAPVPRVVSEAEKAQRRARQDMLSFLGEQDDGQSLTPDPDSMFSDDVVSLDEMAAEEQAANDEGNLSDTADYIYSELNDLFGPESGRITLDALLLGQGERIAKVWDWIKQLAARAYRAGKSLVDYLTGNKVDVTKARDIDAFFQRMNERQGSTESFASSLDTAVKVGEVGKLANWTGVFSVEQPFRRIGAAETGFHLKNIHSIQDMYSEWGLRAARQMTKVSMPKGIDYADATLVAERPSLISKYSEDQQVALRQVVKMWSDLRDKMFSEYEKRGLLTKPWPDSFINRQREQIRKLRDLIKGEKSPATKATLNQQIDDLQAVIKLVEDTKYTPISAAWFYSQDQTNPTNLIKVLKILNATKRETPTLKYLLDQGLITREQADLRDVTAHYMRRVGKDFGLDNLLQAALKDGLIKKGYHEGWGQLPVSKYPVLRGYSIHPNFQDVIEAHLDSGRRPGPAASVGRAIEQGLHLVKAMQFINPLMLPFYDVHQGIMIGTMWREAAGALAGAKIGAELAGPTGMMAGAFAGGVAGMAGHAKVWRKAWKSTLQKDQAFRDAMENGLASKPFSLNYDEINRQLDIIKDPFMGRMMQVVKSPPIGLLKELYAPMWTAAWFGDNLIRMVSYHHLIDKGYSAREAAQLAAKAHGDYAGIPPQTKRVLNSIFFTPSFEIAMAKWYTSMLASYYRAARRMFETGSDVKAGWQRISKGTKAAMAGVVALAVVNFASDHMLKGLGYEPIPGFWGLKYRKKIRTAEGEKEMVVTLSSPSNRPLQYYSIAQRMFDPTTTETVPSQIMKAVKFKFHPLWRIGAELVWNQDPSGNRIYNPFDSSFDKNLAISRHVLRSSLRLYGMFDAQEVNVENEAEIRKNMGSIVYYAMKPFTFSYLRGNADSRARAKINNIKSELESVFGEKKEAPTREQLQRALDMMDEVMREREDANRALNR